MSVKKEFKIEKTKLLIVEGEDERRFFNKWSTELNIEDLQVLPIGGKSKLPSELNILKTLPNFLKVQSIGILRDADNDAAVAFQSVCSALGNSGFDVPKTENEKTYGKPSIKVLILPGNGQTGSIEDLFLNSIADNPIIQCVDDFFTCVSEKQNSLPNQIGKAKVHTYLASNLSDPDKRLGESVEARIWNLNHSAFNVLREFIMQL